MPDDHTLARSARPAARRRTYLLLALVLILVAAGVVAWHVAASSHYLSTTLTLNGVAFPNTRHGWLVGDTYGSEAVGFESGSILATSDGGVIWHRQLQSRVFDPLAVAFIDAHHGWVVGGSTGSTGGGMIAATTDGGANWQWQSVATNLCLVGVAFADARHGWTVGYDSLPLGGGILATTDGGATWRQQLATKDADFSAVACTDRRHAFAVGYGIYATSDGGATWKHVYVLPSSTGLEGVSFANREAGWVVGSDGSDVGLVLATSDGGATWKRQYSDRAGALKEVDFVDARHGWAAGEGGLIATSDGGRTWRRQIAGSTDLSFSGVAFVDPAHGWVATNAYAAHPGAPVLVGSTILRTTDGGARWRH